MAPIQHYLAQALRALDKLLAGDSPDVVGDILMRDLHYVEEWMQLERPLATYAPRSRRRFVAAAKQGYRPKEAYRQERQSRQTASVNKWGLSPAQYRVVHRLMNDINATGVDVEYYHEPEIIKEMVTVYGYSYLVKVFTEQLESIKAFINGDPRIGNVRWHNRGSIEQEFTNRFGAVSFLLPMGTDPYYYYHGRK